MGVVIPSILPQKKYPQKPEPTCLLTSSIALDHMSDGDLITRLSRRKAKKKRKTEDMHGMAKDYPKPHHES